MVLEEGPYVVPMGFAYSEGKVFFHTCSKGLKMESLRKNTNVCFEVDEALSDATMSKSVIIFGTAEIIEDEQRMIPYLQKLIDKYRVPLNFDEYMRKPGRNRESELKATRICLITPTKITGRKLLPKEGLHPTST
jgi:nitroimidazol reductase NimA-like FMN-containing flavoprotein (pyridoxamine 5'-phosphate oxidase superfamily)